MTMYKDKCVVLGVCGGIAVYKALDVVSSLRKKGIEVRVIMTESATKFVTPLTFQTISQNMVVTDMFAEPKAWEIQHISLAQKADVMLIAPATANIIGKVANGIADDMLSTTIMATKAKVIFEHVLTSLHPVKDLCGKKELVTAGPTKANIDPVRFITNRSSGKMGYAIAKEARDRGAEVTLVTGAKGIEKPIGIEVIEIDTNSEMKEEISKRFDSCDIVIKAAAVADYKPKNYSKEKIKKGEGSLNIELTRDSDILKELGEKKDKQILVGFAAESSNLIENAKGKLERKNLDYIIANDITSQETGFGSDQNKVFVISRDGNVNELDIMSKREVASNLFDIIGGKR